jgi:hypothetical protein
MTILCTPLFGAEDGLGGPIADTNQLQIEPRPVLIYDTRRLVPITLPDGFLSGNRNFRVVRVPRTIRTIKQNAFSRMESLEEMDLSATAVEFIFDWFLHETMSVKSCRFPSTLRHLGCYCLSRTSLNRVDLSHTLVEVLPVGFLAFTPVEVLLVPSTLKLINLNALEMTCLRHLDFSHTQLEGIARWAMRVLPLVEIRLPSTLEYVAFSAFEQTQVRSLWVGETEIPWVNAHLFDPELRELRLPSFITFVASNALSGTSLQRVDLSSSRVDFIEENVLCNNPRLEEGFPLLLPEWVTDIPENLPCAGRMAKAIVLPRSIKELGRSAFKRAPFLRVMDLSQSSVAYLPIGFLSDAPNLIDVRLSRSLEMICDEVFLRTSLHAVDLRNTKLRFIGTRFCADSPLRRLYVPEGFVLQEPCLTLAGVIRMSVARPETA